MSLVIGDVLK